MTEQPPDWIENTPSTDSIHNRPPYAGGAFTTPFTPARLLQIGAQLIEQFLSKVVLAIVGVFIPGAGTAFEQLQSWAINLGDVIADIPVLGPILEWLASLFGIDIGDVGDPDVDFGNIWGNVVNVFINPLGFFANLVSGFIPGVQIPGIDASKIISGFIGDGLLPVINSIIGGITGLIPGAPASHNDVADAAAAQSAVLAAISAAVARVEAQLADNDPTTILVEEDFEYTATAPDPTKWDIDYSSGDGHPEVDGHQLVWKKSGALRNQSTMRYIGGADAQSSKDDMTVKIVIGTNVMPDTQPGAPNSVDVLARMNATNDTFVRLKVFKKSFQLQAVNSGVVTVLATQSIATPGIGAIISLQCGDAANHRNFHVTINGTTWDYFDGANVSQVGASYRWRGMGQLAGQVVFLGLTFQENAGPVAHWASQNAA